jgi:TetR/AcrR family transcriptional regulator, transcriptional repressor for nem operon
MLMPENALDSSAPPEAGQHASRTKVLDAALQVFRAKGYAATTVEDVCVAAGLTKGSFFHHFQGKEAMTLAAIAHWNAVTGDLFAQAPYRRLADPRDRVLAYIDFRKQILRGEAAEFSCLLGTLVQETFDTYPRIRDACNDGIARHARVVADDIAAAKALYAPKAAWDPMVLAFFTQATLQGAFVLAKAQGSSRIVAECIDHLRQHVANLLGADAAPAPPRKERRP